MKTVKEIMTAKVFCVTPEETVDRCMTLVTEKRCRQPAGDGERQALRHRLDR